MKTPTPPTTDDLLCRAEALCHRFIAKVDSGRARSVATYAEARAFLNALEFARAATDAPRPTFTAEDLATIRALYPLKAAATPGPWQTRFLYRLLQTVRRFSRRFGLLMNTPPEQDWADADLAASAVNALPAIFRLLDAAEDDRAQVTALTAHLDLMVDEFLRIRPLTRDTEIHGLCDRAITLTRQHLPVLEQRDRAQRYAEHCRAVFLTLEHELTTARAVSNGAPTLEDRATYLQQGLDACLEILAPETAVTPPAGSTSHD